MKISLACDHGGLQLKNDIGTYLKNKGYEVIDCGTNSTDSCDYPDFVSVASRLVADGTCSFGVVVCTTGIGASICANKVDGVRCALCTNTDVAVLTRKHNNSNVIAFGAKYTSSQLAYEMLDLFLNTEFEGGRHQRRVDKITQIENNQL